MNQLQVVNVKMHLKLQTKFYEGKKPHAIAGNSSGKVGKGLCSERSEEGS